MSSTLACVNHQSTAGTPRPKPVASARGPLTFRIASNTQLAASATYNGHDRLTVSRTEPATNVRSNSSTITGADTIASFDAMPAAHVNPASTSHRIRLAGGAAQ